MSRTATRTATPSPTLRTSTAVVQRKCACGAASAAGAHECDSCSAKRGQVQPKLEFSRPGDAFEIEADRVAAQLMAQSAPESQTRAEPHATPAPTMQRARAAAAPSVHDAPNLVDDALASGGRPLSAEARAFFEPRFGHDFSHVRVHTDSAAAGSATAMQARAYTVSNHIAFAPGHYSPGTEAGKYLLAHELTHVVQQTGAGFANAGERVARRGPPFIARDGAPQTPEEMWRNVLQKRGEDYAIPLGEHDATRQKLLELSKKVQTSNDPKVKAEYNRLLNRYNVSVVSESGGKLGTGFSTYCMAQIVDKNGKVVATAFGEFDGKVHAESRALSRLEGQIVGKDLRGARLEIVVDQKVCSHSCQPDIKNFVTKHKLNGAMSWTFQAERVDKKGFKSPKGTAGDVSKPSQANSTVKRVPDFKFPPDLDETPSSSRTYPTPGGAKGPPGGAAPPSGAAPPGNAGPSADAEPNTMRRPSPPSATPHVPDDEPPAKVRPRVPGGAAEIESHPSPKTVAGGMALNLGAGIALGLMQHGFKEKVAKDLENLPKPSIDKRSAAAYLLDPSKASGPRLIDLMNKNFGKLGKELDDDNTQRLNTTFFEFLATPLIEANKAKDYEKRFERLDELADGLRAYEDQLDTMSENLDAIIDEEDKLRAYQKGARDTLKLMERAIVWDELLKMGFQFEEIEQIHMNLKSYVAAIDRILRDAKSLKKKIEELQGKSEKMREQIDEAWKIELGSQFGQHLKEKRAEEAWLRQQKEQYVEMVACDWLNSDQKGLYYELRTQESQGLFKLQDIEKKLKTEESEGMRNMLRAQYAEIRNIIDDIRKRKSKYECKQVRVPV